MTKKKAEPLTQAKEMNDQELAAALIDALKEEDILKEQINALAENIGLAASIAKLAELNKEVNARAGLCEQVVRGNQVFEINVTSAKKVALKDKELTPTIVDRAARDFGVKGKWLFTTALNQKNAEALYGSRLPSFLTQVSVNKTSIKEI